MALTSLNDILSNLTGGGSGSPQHPFFFFDNRIQGAAATVTVANNYTSLWRYNKTNGAHGAIPSSVGVPMGSPCDNLTPGALPLTNPTGGRKLYLLGMEFAGFASGVLQVYDRLWHSAGLDCTLTTTQSISSSGPITRNTGGVGNEIWIEIYSLIGAGQVGVRVNYTNQDGVAKQSQMVSFGGSSWREESRIMKVCLADGDTGVRSVESVIQSANAGVSAGANYGITIARPIGMLVNEQNGAAGFRDFIAGTPILPEIPAGACLAFTWLPSIASSGTRGLVSLHIVEA